MISRERIKYRIPIPEGFKLVLFEKWLLIITVEKQSFFSFPFFPRACSQLPQSGRLGKLSVSLSLSSSCVITFVFIRCIIIKTNPNKVVALYARKYDGSVCLAGFMVS